MTGLNRKFNRIANTIGTKNSRAKYMRVERRENGQHDDADRPRGRRFDRGFGSPDVGRRLAIWAGVARCRRHRPSARSTDDGEAALFAASSPTPPPPSCFAITAPLRRTCAGLGPPTSRKNDAQADGTAQPPVTSTRAKFLAPFFTNKNRP